MSTRLVAAFASLLLTWTPLAVCAKESGERSFLWRATQNGRTVYLLGSIHFMRENAYPLKPAIEAAYRQAGVVVFETDIGEMDRAAVAMMKAGTLPADQSLRGTVPPELYAAVTARMEELGMGMAMLDRMRPWLVAVSLTSLELMQAGYLGTQGIDIHLSTRADDDGKEQRGLETVEYQVSLFADLSAEESMAFLEYTLSELEMVIPVIDEVVDAWSAGNVPRLERYLAEGFDEHPELFERLVTRRNSRWLPTIEEFFDGPTDALVVVGSLHLVGEQGLIELLRAKGYEVEQL